MARKEIDEMAQYRVGALKAKPPRRGRRSTDSEGFFTLGWVLEFLFLLVMGVWLLSACARYL